jgi:urease accessory protein
MLEIRARFDRKGDVPLYGRLRLPFDRRQKSRQRATLESGEEVAIVLARGEVMRGGDLVVAADGQVIEVVAERESVMHVECDCAPALARVAYHLGNRHVPVQVGDQWLRFAADSVLEKMVAGLGANVSVIDAPFEPEAGAYAPHHRHDNLPPHGGRIHEFESRNAE